MKLINLLKQTLTLVLISIIFLSANSLAEASNEVRQDLELNEYMMQKISEVDETVNTFVLDNSELKMSDTEVHSFLVDNYMWYPHVVSNNVKRAIVSRECFEETLKCNLNFKFFYYDSKSDIETFNREMETYANTLNGKSFEEKVGAITSYVKSMGDYGYAEKGSAHSPVTLFNEGWGVCQAYAVATQRLLTYSGIDNYLLTGLANGSEHVWNVVFDEQGNMYHLDVTWEDILNNKKYYMISTSQLDSLGTHVYEVEHLNIIKDAYAYFKTDRPNPEPNPVEIPDEIYGFLTNIESSTYLGDLGEQPKDKAFSINFSSNVGKNYEPKIFIYNKDTRVSLPVKFDLKGKSLIVQSSAGEMDKGDYYLIILSGIESDDEPPLITEQDYYITFEIK